MGKAQDESRGNLRCQRQKEVRLMEVRLLTGQFGKTVEGLSGRIEDESDVVVKGLGPGEECKREENRGFPAMNFVLPLGFNTVESRLFLFALSHSGVPAGPPSPIGSEIDLQIAPAFGLEQKDFRDIALPKSFMKLIGLRIGKGEAGGVPFDLEEKPLFRRGKSGGNGRRERLIKPITIKRNRGEGRHLNFF